MLFNKVCIASLFVILIKRSIGRYVVRRRSLRRRKRRRKRNRYRYTRVRFRFKNEQL